jgi:hypothetical protein
MDKFGSKRACDVAKVIGYISSGEEPAQPQRRGG